jgi:hypothetical protein
MYKPALNVYIKPQHRRKTNRLAGMLRGLLNSYEGFRPVSGLTNTHFEEAQCVRLRFSSVRKAHAFKKDVDALFGRYIEVRRIRQLLR